MEKTEVKIEDENDFKEESVNNDLDSEVDEEFNNECTILDIPKGGDDKNVETIKIDRDNIEDFINNDVFTRVDFPNGDENDQNGENDVSFMDEDDEDDVVLSNIAKSVKSKKIDKIKVSKEDKVKNGKVKRDKKKRVKSEVKGRPGRKPGKKIY